MDQTAAWWRPTGPLARALMVLLAVQGIGQLVRVAEGTDRGLDDLARGIDAALDGREGDAERHFENFSSGSDASFLQLAGLVSVAVLVLFVIWQWRSTKNAAALGRTGARISPGWVIAGWLVPVANFFVPYVGLQDLWRNTDPQAEPGDGWRRLSGSPIVTSFWITYVVGLVTPVAVTAVVLATSVEARETDAFTRAGTFVYVVASVLGIFVVRQITARQEHQQETTPAAIRAVSSSARTDAGYATDARGWHPDPLGRFEYRYWDGNVWTDWVSRSGQMSIDPEPVPGYDSPAPDEA